MEEDIRCFVDRMGKTALFQGFKELMNLLLDFGLDGVLPFMEQRSDVTLVGRARLSTLDHLKESVKGMLAFFSVDLFRVEASGQTFLKGLGIEFEGPKKAAWITFMAAGTFLLDL